MQGQVLPGVFGKIALGCLHGKGQFRYRLPVGLVYLVHPDAHDRQVLVTQRALKEPARDTAHGNKVEAQPGEGLGPVLTDQRGDAVVVQVFHEVQSGLLEVGGHQDIEFRGKGAKRVAGAGAAGIGEHDPDVGPLHQRAAQGDDDGHDVGLCFMRAHHGSRSDVGAVDLDLRNGKRRGIRTGNRLVVLQVDVDGFQILAEAHEVYLHRHSPAHEVIREHDGLAAAGHHGHRDQEGLERMLHQFHPQGSRHAVELDLELAHTAGRYGRRPLADIADPVPRPAGIHSQRIDKDVIDRGLPVALVPVVQERSAVDPEGHLGIEHQRRPFRELRHEHGRTGLAGKRIMAPGAVYLEVIEGGIALGVEADIPRPLRAVQLDRGEDRIVDRNGCHLAGQCHRELVEPADFGAEPSKRPAPPGCGLLDIHVAVRSRAHRGKCRLAGIPEHHAKGGPAGATRLVDPRADPEGPLFEPDAGPGDVAGPMRAGLGQRPVPGLPGAGGEPPIVEVPVVEVGPVDCRGLGRPGEYQGGKQAEDNPKQKTASHVNHSDDFHSGMVT